MLTLGQCFPRSPPRIACGNSDRIHAFMILKASNPVDVLVVTPKGVLRPAMCNAGATLEGL